MDSLVSRWVTFFFGPLAVIGGSFVAIKAKQWFGYDLQPAEATAYILGVAGSIGGGVVIWLRNRGRHELATKLGVDEAQVDAIVDRVVQRLPQPPAQVPLAGRPPTDAGQGA